MNVRKYQPSSDVLAYLEQVHFGGVVGPTAVGKSTLIDKVLERDPSVRLVRSTTSRAPRPGETDGVDMQFRSKAEMEGRIARREYVQVVPTFDNYYASAPEDYAEHGVSLMPVLAAAVPDFRALPFAQCRIIFVLPPSFEEWQARVAERTMTSEQLHLRFAEALPSFEFASVDPEVIFVLNDDLDIAAEELLEVLHNGKADSAQQAACRQLAEQLRARVSAELLQNKPEA